MGDAIGLDSIYFKSPGLLHLILVVLKQINSFNLLIKWLFRGTINLAGIYKLSPILICMFV